MPDFWQQPIRGYPKAYDPWANPAGCTFDHDTAERVCEYWESTYTLKDGKFEGQPFLLADWQKQIVGHLFGWKRADGTRRYRTLFLYIPKKNGKTQYGAAIGLTLLHADGEQGAEVYSCASDVTQAKIVFDAAARMVEHSPKLADKIRVFQGYKALRYGKRFAYWKVLSSRAESKHGPNVHGLIIDELHTQRDTELISTLEAGTISRAQPLVVKMTTAGHTGDTPCNAELEYARGVRDGGIEDPYYMPVIYDGQAADKDDPERWKDPDFWPLVNPNYGLTVGADYFEREVRKCETQPSHAEVVKRLHLNIQTDAASQWLDGASWKACGERGVEMDGPCWGALDLASTADINALTLYWPQTQSAVNWYWIPEETARGRAEWTGWRKHNRVMVTDGPTTDYRYIRQTINTLNGKFKIQSIAFDPWNATHLVTELSDEDDIKMVEYRQGYASMNAASKALEAMVLSRELRHDNNPVTNWMAGNAAIQTDPAGNIKPVKPRRGSPLKVDGIVTLVMAVGLAGAEVETEERDHGAAVIVI